jgi:hypothetical protein
MNTLKDTIRYVIFLSLAVTLLAAHTAFSQVEESTNLNLQWVQIPTVPEGGTFWSWQLQSNFPPSPVDPWPELPLFQLQIADSTNYFGQFLYDDRTIIYSGFRAIGSFKTNRESGRFTQKSDKEVPAPGGSGGGGPADTWDGVTNHPNYTVNSATAYNLYTNFWLAISNDSTNAYVTAESTLSNLTYEIFTNDDLTQTNGWGLWVTLLATNNVTPAPPLALGTNQLFFEGLLAGSTTTNGLADWWCMQYFGTLNVNPYADPDGDGLCNWDEFMLGTNPTNANSISSSHNDAQALFLAYTNDSMCHYQLAVSNGPDTNTLIVTMWPTVIGTNYQIYSKDYSVSNSAWRVEVSFVGTNTVTSVEVSINGRDLGLIGGYAEDDDGDGLPTAYEVLATLTDPLLPDTGQTGIIDGFKDPDGDGYVNIVEYQNGTDPHVFDVPPAPTGVSVTINNDGSTTIKWAAAPGSPTGYVVERTTSSGTTDFSLSSSQLSYLDTSLLTGQNASYRVQAVYSTLSSIFSPWYDNLYRPNLNIDPIIVNGFSNRLVLVVPNLPVGVTNLVISRTNLDNQYFDPYNDATFGSAYYPLAEYRWGITGQEMPPGLTNGNFSIAVSSLTNSCITLTDSQVPLYGAYSLYVQPFGSNNTYGQQVEAWGPTVGTSGYNADHIRFGYTGVVPFLDGTPQLYENLSFTLRASFTQPLGWLAGDGFDSTLESFNMSSNYVYASYYDIYDGIDQLIPFEDNYGYHNCSFFPDLAHGSSYPNTGLDVFDSGVSSFVLPTNCIYEFDAYGFAASGSQTAPSPQLADTNTQWIYDCGLPFGYVSCDEALPPEEGMYCGGASTVCMSNPVVAYYGLPYVSVQMVVTDFPSIQFELLNPGSCVPETAFNPAAYIDLQAPIFHTIGYYFAKYGAFTNGCYDPTLRDPIPGDGTQSFFPSRPFNPTNQSPLIVMPLGGQQIIAGYAKEIISNGFSTVSAFLGQYFTNAFFCINGSVTTNSGGILSEYGNFYATTAGQVALLTEPDTNQGNLQGQCTVNVIALQTDVNRDGVLDPTVTGGDFTTPNHPFRFWVNDDDDTGDDDGNGIPGQVGIEADGTKYIVSGSQVIYPVHGTRDLVDYFPVYLNMASVAQMWLTNSQYTNLEFRLSQADGALRFVYTSLTPTNFIDYLHNTNVAESLAGAYTTTITSSGVDLTNSFLEQIATNNQGVVIVEAWDPTTQPLVLDILQNGNVIAKTSLYLSITGVEQMFRHKNLTAVVPPYVQDGMPDRLQDSDVPNEPDANDKNFIFLHGYNVTGDSARGNFADVFKRLYWSGSHARFYGLSWRSDTSLTSILGFSLTPNFHTNVVNAFSTASNVANFLGTLSGTNIVAAHSLGNMVVLSALNDWNAAVSQYYMIDAAVAIEDLQDDAPETSDMIVSAWLPFTNRLYAHEWHNLFTSGDGRNALTWAGRLSNLRSADVYNFYSSGEEVLRDYSSDPPAQVLTAIPSQIGATLHGAQGAYVWVWQEKGKGISANNDEIGSNHGGWGFNDQGYLTNPYAYYNMLPSTPPLSASAAAALSDSQLQTNSFFDFQTPPFYLNPFTNDLALLGPSGSAYAQANLNRILADAIPALTLPIGANPIPGSGIVVSNINMQEFFENGWPSDRLESSETNNWHHSDYRQVAYTFTYPLYTNFVYVGGLK